MSYCVNCGVELGEGTRKCPLCGTPVIHPGQQNIQPETPYFTQKQERIQPVSKRELALLLSAMLASVAICCGLLNIALRPDIKWSFYAAGAAIMLWIWFVPPLLWRKIPFLLKVGIRMAAVCLYILVIALVCDGLDWYGRLALPILFSGAVIGLVLCDLIRNVHLSILSSSIALLIAVGVQCAAIELFVDRFLWEQWHPGWSLIVLAVCLGLCVPLIVVRCVPSLREEVRRRFHL